jgi:CHAT domain-containing protein
MEFILKQFDNQITQLFMIEFYTQLVKNKNINLALRMAKKKIKVKYDNPYYWAAFILIQKKN